MCMTDSFCCTVEMNTTLYSNYTPIKVNNKKKIYNIVIHHEDLITFLLFTPKFISAKGSNYPEFECLISIWNLDSIYLIEHVYVHMCM